MTAHKPSRWRKRPVEVDAILMDGTKEGAQAALAFIGDQTLGTVLAVPHKVTP